MTPPARSAAVLLSVLSVACSSIAATGPVVHESHSVERGAATSARVDIDMRAGELAVTSGAMTLIGDVSGTGLEERDGRWINPRATTSPVTVNFEVQRAIGDLKIVAE